MNMFEAKDAAGEPIFQWADDMEKAVEFANQTDICVFSQTSINIQYIYMYMYMCHFQQEMHHESKMAAASRILAVESREWQASKI